MSYDVLAVLIVLTIPFAMVGLIVIAAAWADDALARERTTGLVGIACTGIAAVNLLIPRSCGDEVNRPIVAIVTGSGDCFRMGLLSVEVVLLLAVATSVAVRFPALRR